MTTSKARGTIFAPEEENSPVSFGEWFKCHRQELDLTQDQLAKRASCSVFAIRKIEIGERKPSRQLANLLAQSLEIPPEDQDSFIKAARGELSIERFVESLCAHARNPQPVSSAGAAPINLPRLLTPFIGREPELSALNQLLDDPQCSLLTVVGPGGIGKTRLVIEAASQSKDHFTDGIWFIPLAALHSPAMLVHTIANALNFRFQNPTDPQKQLLLYLREKKALLILDNAEHLLEGAGLFAEILDACSQVKLLVTSRERLNLLSEWIFEVRGLPVPASERAEQFENYSAVALFLQGARRVLAGFELREKDRPCVLRICQILEGMPLGIELAAAWVGLLSCEEIAKEIERNIDFLSVEMRDLPERHRSLRATLDYSWKLLTAEEKLTLSRLSVFRGSFRREAADAICGANLAVLSSFHNKMLLYRREQDLYFLHEIIRQYAHLKLMADPDEARRAKDAHSAYYVRCLAEWMKDIKSARQIETINEIAQVIDDLALGWQHMITSFRPETVRCGAFRPDLFKNSLFSLNLFYEMRHRSQEAVALFKESAAYLKSIEGAFTDSEESPVFDCVLGLVSAYLGYHQIYFFQYEQAEACLEEAVFLLERGQCRIETAQAQVISGLIYLIEGQLQKSVDLLEQSRVVFREEGETWWYMFATLRLASPYISLRKLQKSEALLLEGFELVDPGDLYLGIYLRGIYAFLLHIKKEYARAEQLLHEILPFSVQLQDVGLNSNILCDLGRLALATKRYEQAEAYFWKSINVLGDLEKYNDYSINRLYLGKCFAAQHNLPAAHDQFRLVIERGHAVNHSMIVYWGLVNIASLYLEEGQIERALELALVLRHIPIEYETINEEIDALLADSRSRLPARQVDAAMQQVDAQFSTDWAGTNALAYALERVVE